MNKVKDIKHLAELLEIPESFIQLNKSSTHMTSVTLTFEFAAPLKEAFHNFEGNLHNNFSYGVEYKINLENYFEHSVKEYFYDRLKSIQEYLKKTMVDTNITYPFYFYVTNANNAKRLDDCKELKL